MFSSLLFPLFSLSIFLLFESVCGAVPACVRSTADSVPYNPGILLTSAKTPNNASLFSFLSTGGKMTAGCSERVSGFSQTRPYTGPDSSVASSQPSLPNPAVWPRMNCPHLRSGLSNFESLFTGLSIGSDVTLQSGQRVLLRSCSIDDSIILNRITINSGASLIFDDAPITLKVREIWVMDGGELLIGSPTCRLYSKIDIQLHGSAADSSATDAPTGATSKGIVSEGLLEMHGKLYFPTWTRLSRTVPSGSLFLPLQERVNWEVGQQILVTPTILFDCPDSYASQWCKPCDSWQNCQPVRHQNEIRTIAAVRTDIDSEGTILQLDRPLSFGHYGGREYQAEVALLSRRITISGVQSNDRFGGHVKIANTGEGRLSGVRGDNLGQLNVLGRYPFHFHMLSDFNRSSRSYAEDCSVTHSNFRCFVIHGTNNVRLSRNVAFNVSGMCYYLEDGVEENNLLEYNLAAHVHPILQPADGGGGQGGETFLSQAGLLIPVDTTASGYYSLNAYNSWIGNSASGGWSGFAFPNCPAAVGNFRGVPPPNANSNPLNRPLKRFVGNQAHSTGFYWREHAPGIYFGAHLDYNSNGVMRYNSGRNARTTRFPNGTVTQMYLEHTKTFLVNKGISHWGDQVSIYNYECYDCRVGAMLFGSASIVNALIVGRTPNFHPVNCWPISRWQMGFQFYDTWVMSILSEVTFRNYSSAPTSSASKSYAIRYMDHSDQFLPQGINSIRSIRFQNIDPSSRLGIDNCGALCNTARATMSSKIYSVWDSQGDLSGTGRPSIVGSSLTWWNVSELNCQYRSNLRVFTCDWMPGSNIGYIGPYLKGIMDGCDGNLRGNCSGQSAYYTVGRMTQWGGADGYSRGVDLSPWPGVAGVVNTGWYWRAKAPVYGVDGAPSLFRIDETTQLPRNHFVVLAVAYPPTAQFQVYLQAQWWGYRFPDIPMAPNLSYVLTPTEQLKPSSQFDCSNTQWWGMCRNTGGIGPAWFFDGSHLYLRVVYGGCYNNNQKLNCERDGAFSDGGVQVPRTRGGFPYVINVTSCAGCTVQSVYSGITYYQVADSPPAQRFPVAYRPFDPLPPQDPAPGTFASCPSIDTVQVVNSPSDPNPDAKGNAASSRCSLSFFISFSLLLLSFFLLM